MTDYEEEIKDILGELAHSALAHCSDDGDDWCGIEAEGSGKKAVESILSLITRTKREAVEGFVDWMYDGKYFIGDRADGLIGVNGKDNGHKIANEYKIASEILKDD